MSTLNVTNAQVTTLKDASGNNPSTPAEINSGRAKAWINFDHNAANIRGSHNVTSVTDGGAGILTVVLDNDMADVNYCIVTAANGTSADSNNDYMERMADNSNRVVGSFKMECRTGAGSYLDNSVLMAAVFGDLA